MITRRGRILLSFTACLAFLARGVPGAACDGCGLPCGAERADAGGHAASAAATPHASGCPLCAAAAPAGGGDGVLSSGCVASGCCGGGAGAAAACADAGSAPCGCRITSRPHDPPAQPRTTSWAVDPADQAAGPAATLPESPAAIGVSREYLAASLAVPIRPARILFGVWRN